MGLLRLLSARILLKVVGNYKRITFIPSRDGSCKVHALYLCLHLSAGFVLQPRQITVKVRNSGIFINIWLQNFGLFVMRVFSISLSRNTLLACSLMRDCNHAPNICLTYCFNWLVADLKSVDAARAIAY